MNLKTNKNKPIIKNSKIKKGFSPASKAKVKISG